MIDIIVPTYDRYDDVVKFIEEINKQTYQHFQVVFIDDNGSVDIETIISKEGHRFKYIKLDENRGQAYARNHAAKQSTADFLFFLDDDAWFMNDTALENFVSEADTYECDGWMFDVKEPNKELLSLRIKKNNGDAIGEFVACACAFRRKSFEEIGGFLPFFHSYGEETEVVMRLILQGKKMIFLPLIQVFHNYEPGARSREWMNRFLFNSMRNDIYIVMLHYPLFLIPVYSLLKYFSRLIWILKVAENKFDAFRKTTAGLFFSIRSYHKIGKYRSTLTWKQFNYWLSIRW